MQPLAPADPRRIGEFRLAGRLGAGGMGQVFLGHGTDGVPVAVKVVHSRFAADPQFRARFAREVKTVSAARGRRVAALVAADPHASSPWLATEYVAGPSVDQLVTASGPLPEESAGLLAGGLAEALAQLHELGIVHRDIKPSNVLLAEDGPKLIDFGIARAADATAITETGVVVGTPAYMSPEQALGVHIGPPSDVFSLASVLVYAMTGQGPFGSTCNALAMLRRISDDQPELAEVPQRFRAELAACFAKDPARRPTAAELAHRLAGTVESTDSWRPTLVATKAIWSGTAPPPRRAVNRRTLVLGAGAVLGLGAAGAALVHAVSPAAPPVRPAPVPASPAPSVVSPTEGWTVEAADEVGALAASPELVYLAGARGVQAVNASDGESRWQVDVVTAAGPVSTDVTLSLAAGTLCFTSNAGVTALDPATGQRRWQRDAGALDVLQGLAGVKAQISDGVVYATVGNQVHAMDLGTGATHWMHQVADRFAGSPVSVGGRCYVISGASVEALDAASGRPVWRYESGQDNASTLAVSGGVVVVSSKQLAVVGLDAKTGAVRWRDTLDGHGTGLRDRMVTAGGVALALGVDNRVHALDVDSGAPRWTQPDPSLDGASTDMAPVVDATSAYVASTVNDRVYAMELGTGTRRWSYRARLNGVDQLAASNGAVYLAGREQSGASYAVRAVQL